MRSMGTPPPPPAGPTAAPGPGSALPWWLRSETRRSTVSAGVATVVTFVIEVAWLWREPGLRDHGWAVGCVLAWGLFAALHTVMTHRAHRDVDPAALAGTGADEGIPEPLGWWRRVQQRAAEWWGRGWSSGNDAPSWSVQVSVLALVVVALIMVTPALRSSQGLLVAALAMVAASWANVAVMYAVHYARIDARTSGLGFPGDEPRAFADYLYLALAVQTTFGTTDVELTTRQLRRTATVHGVLAFVFNSVIVAMIISLLLGVATG